MPQKRQGAFDHFSLVSVVIRLVALEDAVIPAAAAAVATALALIKSRRVDRLITADLRGSVQQISFGPEILGR